MHLNDLKILKNINLNKIKIKFFKKYFKNVKINSTEYDDPNKSLHIFAEERRSLKLKYYRLERLHQNTNINCSFPPGPCIIQITHEPSLESKQLLLLLLLLLFKK